MGRLVFALVLVGFTVSCTQGHCRRRADTPAMSKELSEAPLETSQDGERIYVYKYDGSLQCGRGKPVSPEVMAKELNEIMIYSSRKKSDGRMHIQVCGYITGMANVFEINAKDLAKAESKGFKKWEFD